MTTNANPAPETDKAAPQGGTPGAAPPGGQETVQQPPPKAGEEAAKTKGAEEQQRPPSTPKLLGDDDEELDDKAPYQITGAALKKRLGRFTKKQLREQFGTDDPEIIKTKLKRLDELEAKAEEDRRAKLDEQERVKEDLRKEQERANLAEQRLREVEENRVIEQQDQRITAIASKHIDPEVLEDVVLPKFARHLKRNLSESEINALTSSDIEKWFKEYAEKHPKFAANPPEQREPPKPKQPATNTASSNNRPTPAAGTGEKTAKPGQPNSMTKEEIRKLGYNY